MSKAEQQARGAIPEFMLSNWGQNGHSDDAHEKTRHFQMLRPMCMRSGGPLTAHLMQWVCRRLRARHNDCLRWGLTPRPSACKPRAFPLGYRSTQQAEGLLAQAPPHCHRLGNERRQRGAGGGHEATRFNAPCA